MSIRIYPTNMDRPIVGAVALDPAYVAATGFAVGRYDEPSRLRSWSGSWCSPVTYRRLGDAVVEMCRPGERLELVVENTAYGAKVARMFGIVIGAVEATLLDLNAVEPNTRIDVGAGKWRTGLGITGRGRAELKKAAILYARDVYPHVDGRDDNEAEAVCIFLWAMSGHG